MERRLSSPCESSKKPGDLTKPRSWLVCNANGYLRSGSGGMRPRTRSLNPPQPMPNFGRKGHLWEDETHSRLENCLESRSISNCPFWISSGDSDQKLESITRKIILNFVSLPSLRSVLSLHGNLQKSEKLQTMDLGDAITELETFVWNLGNICNWSQPSYYAMKHNQTSDTDNVYSMSQSLFELRNGQ